MFGVPWCMILLNQTDLAWVI